jgi:hypothetical protein
MPAVGSVPWQLFFLATPEQMTYADARLEMLLIAAAYEKLAKHAEERTSGKKSPAWCG